MKNLIKKLIPKKVKRVLGIFNKLLNYKDYDSSAYWRGRAKDAGQAAVLWKNQEYNNLYRADQKNIIREYVEKLDCNTRVLDIGCGVGVVANMISELNDKTIIDAVDFDEMIQVAKLKYNSARINYITNSAEEYYQDHYKYDLIISSGCFSAIRNIDNLEKALNNSARMISSDGIILMIDPFHRWNYLARAKYNTKDVELKMSKEGLSLIRKGGILFWPYRDALADSNIYGPDLVRKYKRGEKLLRLMGQNFWADYKILVFKKIK
jgi:2-polyprenyl-3-methyl-5-hydroxy-6-metoxy-1,4-benzoquinol methylase